MSSIDLIATSTFGLEAIVARELTDLGYPQQTIENGRVLFTADSPADIARCNLHLRVADRVMIRVAEFQARDFGVLFDTIIALPWEQYLPADAAFPVSGKSVKSQLSSVPAIQRATKKAIVQRLLEAHHVDALPETGPAFPIRIGLLKDRVTLCIDTTGPGLHKRGYRDLTGAAPLKETLAAALVMLSFWQPDRPFIDPFCGSGTIAIEAALIGRKIPPGLQRTFISEPWPVFDHGTWDQARQQAREQITDPGERLLAYDIDERALSMARRHAERAGVGDDIHFQLQAFEQLRNSRPHGCLITNPPYGQRLGEQQEVEALYRVMPEIFSRLDSWSIYVLTAHPEFESLLGQNADRRRKLYNGRIPCTYYQFHGPKPGQPKNQTAKPDTQSKSPPPPTPAFGGLPQATDRQAEEFTNRLIKRARHLRRWPKRGIGCFRLYERDVPDVPLIVDRYEDCLHIAEYERPNEHTAAQHVVWLNHLAKAAAQALDIPRKQVFIKQRAKQRGLTQHEKQNTQHYEKQVTENGLRFIVNLSDYIDTGLFLDHRQTRQMVREQAMGKRFLNLFCYTGAFTVYAAAGGAKSTVSVDLSNTYLDWARRNLHANQLADDQRHRFVKRDIMTFLSRHPPGEFFDLAVIDPPTYSNSKTTEQDWDLQRDHVTLLNAALALMPVGGVIYFSNNFRRFKFDELDIHASQIKEISKQTVPEDFRNKRIHRCWQLIK